MRWQYEDEMPPLSDAEYAAAFPSSKVIDGVRMFPMFDLETSRAMSAAIAKLTGQLVQKQDQLRRCELSQGTDHDVRKMVRLRDEIASLELRLSLAETVQDRIQ